MAGAFNIYVKADRASVVRELGVLEKKQLPFAIATALTAVAKSVAAVEKDNFRSVFSKPSPFTLNSIGVKPARKSNLEAWVFVKDKTAAYLEPYETGGAHVLPGKALLNPKGIALNQYGQLPKGVLAKLRGRADIFIGTVKTKKGPVSGVWQRPVRDNQLGAKRPRGGGVRKVNTTDHLKLLIRFGDAIQVKKHLDYRAHAGAAVQRSFAIELTKAMVAARLTAR